MSTLVGYLIVREPYEPNHSDAGGSDSEDYEGENKTSFSTTQFPYTMTAPGCDLVV